MKNYSKHISGLTLIEIMIGIVITTIMMAAVYTSYSVVNQSYSQVSEKAKISRASRDIAARDAYLNMRVRRRFGL